MSQRWLSLDDARQRASEVTPAEFVTWHPSWILLAGEIRTGQLMTEFDISAVVVCDEREQIVGIVTERDLSRRVVAENRTPGTTRVTDIMTADPRVLAPDYSAFDAL